LDAGAYRNAPFVNRLGRGRPGHRGRRRNPPHGAVRILAAFGVTIPDIVLATIMAPEVWLDQRGLLMREVPLLALNRVALAILDER
jgi:hypothetical protein